MESKKTEEDVLSGDQSLTIEWNDFSPEQAVLQLSDGVATIQATVANLEKAQQVSQQTLECKISI
jgi:hypothetical protein